MPLDDHKILPISADQCLDAAAVLARAFRNYPTVVSMLREKEEHERVNILTPIYNAYFQVCEQYGLCFLAVDKQNHIGGVAVIYPPGVYPLPESILTEIFQEAKKQMNEEEINRWIALLQVFDEHHPKSSPHYYLEFIGVDTKLQGQGFGTKLLTDLIKKASQEGVGIFLETADPKNVQLYKKFNFEIIATQKLVDMTLWFMWKA